MGLVIHQDRIDAPTAEALIALCPFGALEYAGGALAVNAACKGCRLCVKNGKAGAVTWEDEPAADADTSAWRGVAVFAELRQGRVHPVTLELLGKARELADAVGHPVYALVIASGQEAAADELLHYGADAVYLYDDPAFAYFTVSPYAAAFHDFIEQARPSSILVGATPIGRSLSPKVAARCRTGLTADCTMLEMKENADLVQIRPAFGGNIMAQIVTPRARPQFCTARYKIFSAPARTEEAKGRVVRMPVTDGMRKSDTDVLSVAEKPQQTDISDADVIVACGRGFTRESELDMARELCALLGGQLACTRPLIEAGWMDPRRQIGLSGRTVKPRLIVTLGVSGSVQFAAGMRDSARIVAVNSDPHAGIFDVAHVGVVGDIRAVVPRLIARIKEGTAHV